MSRVHLLVVVVSRNRPPLCCGSMTGCGNRGGVGMMRWPATLSFTPSFDVSRRCAHKRSLLGMDFLSGLTRGKLSPLSDLSTQPHCPPPPTHQSALHSSSPLQATATAVLRPQHLLSRAHSHSSRSHSHSSRSHTHSSWRAPRIPLLPVLVGSSALSAMCASPPPTSPHSSCTQIWLSCRSQHHLRPPLNPLLSTPLPHPTLVARATAGAGRRKTSSRW